MRTYDGTWDTPGSIFSRNTGIVPDRIREAHVVIVGCGSVGSFAAVELARAGVSHFMLIDTDKFGVQNLSRHELTIEWDGLPKVDGLAEKIVATNPTSKVIAIEEVAEFVDPALFDRFLVGKSGLIIGAADNRQACAWAGRVARMTGSHFVAIGLWERAAAGEIFIQPKNSGPCYECALGRLIGGVQQGRFDNYTTDEGVNLDFIPGLNVDIIDVAVKGVKVAIDLLCQGPGYEPRILGSLQNYVLVCNSDNVAHGGQQVEIFSYPGQIAKVKIEFGAGCPPCKWGRDGVQ